MNDCRATGAAPLQVLSFTSVFPNPREPRRAPFVVARIAAVAELAEVKVVAPVALIDYSHPERRIFDAARSPARRKQGCFEIFHPRWFFPPLGTALNVACLAAGAFWRVLRIRSRFRFQVIDAHFGYPDGAAAAAIGAAIGTPVAITIRGNEMIFGRRGLRRQILRWAFRRADRIIAVSEELRQFAISLGARPALTRVIPNGVDTSIFHPRDRARCRKSFGAAPGTRLLLSAGGLGPGKGHQHVIAALQRLRARGIDAELLIAGAENRDGSYSVQLRELVAALALEDRVRFLGHLAPERLAEAMCAADVFCLASSAEGWPNVVHEALACGAPVVATAVGAIPQMLPADTYGIVVPPGDAVALETAMADALDRPWNRDAIAAWGGARSWRDVAAEVVEELRGAAAAV